jgi:hypothetical protein
MPLCWGRAQRCRSRAAWRALWSWCWCWQSVQRCARRVASGRTCQCRQDRRRRRQTGWRCCCCWGPGPRLLKEAPVAHDRAEEADLEGGARLGGQVQVGRLGAGVASGSSCCRIQAACVWEKKRLSSRQHTRCQGKPERQRDRQTTSRYGRGVRGGDTADVRGVSSCNATHGNRWHGGAIHCAVSLHAQMGSAEHTVGDKSVAGRQQMVNSSILLFLESPNLPCLPFITQQAACNSTDSPNWRVLISTPAQGSPFSSLHSD